MRTKDGTAHIRRTVTRGKKRSTSHESELLPGATGEGLSNVGYGCSYTKGLPNYSAVKVEVDVHLPCHPGEENITIKRARSFVLKRLRAEIRETMRELADDLAE